MCLESFVAIYVCMCAVCTASRAISSDKCMFLEFNACVLNRLWRFMCVCARCALLRRVCTWICLFGFYIMLLDEANYLTVIGK